MKDNRKIQSIIMSLGLSSTITATIALLMGIFSIPITVILPTSAPIWMGFITISMTMIQN